MKTRQRNHVARGRPAPRTSPDQAQLAHLLQRALSLHQTGHWDQARTHYEALLAFRPQEFDVLHLLGVLLYQKGDFGQAEQCLRKAIEVRPEAADAHSNLGLALQDLRRPDEALACFDRAIALKYGYPEAHSNRGFTLMSMGQLQAALEALRTAVGLNPKLPQAHLNLGLAFMQLQQPAQALPAFDAVLSLTPGHEDALEQKANALRLLARHEEALQIYERLLQAKPQAARVHCHRGTCLQELQRYAQAVEAFTKATDLDPRAAVAHCNLGAALQALKRHEEAVYHYETALRWDSSLAVAHCNMGTAYLELARFQAALECYDKAIALRPEYPEAWSNRGGTLHKLGQFGAALASYDRALQCRPDYASAQWNRSITLLLLGRFAEGWAAYEWRWRWDEFPSARRAFAVPQWTGQSLTRGTAVLIHAEQGLGDTIQFSRYASKLKSLGVRVVLEVPRALKQLMQTLEGVDDLIAAGDAIPHFDFHCPLGSLPLAFSTRINNIPCVVPYLSAEPARIQRWAQKLGAQGYRICICWQGKPGRIDQGRSFPVRLFQAIGELAHVRLISVHKGAGEGQLQHGPSGLTVETLGPELDQDAAFIDTAAVMKNCHLVITSDTAVAHLAGALGVPVWVALKRVPDWRWMLNREDSPWYPSIRLFRQHLEGDWTPVFAAMAEAVQACLADWALKGAEPGSGSG